MIWYDTIVSNIFLLCCHVEGTSITCWEIMAWENVSKWCWSWNQAALLGSWKVNILKVLQECVRKYMWVSVHVVFLMDILPCPSLLLALASPILLLYNRLPYMLIIITVKPVWWSGERGYRSVLTHSLSFLSLILCWASDSISLCLTSTDLDDTIYSDCLVGILMVLTGQKRRG